MVRELTAILVSWRDAAETIAAVESLAAARSRVGADGPTVSLVVVDNGGGALDPDALAARWPGATLLVNEANRGFGPAVNQAAAAVSKRRAPRSPRTRASTTSASPAARASAA